MSNLKGVGWCIKPHTDAPWLHEDIYYRKSIHETKYFDNLNLLYPWLFEENPRILLVFYILA